MSARLNGGDCLPCPGTQAEPVDPCQTCGGREKIRPLVKAKVCRYDSREPSETIDAKYELKLMDNLPKLQGHHNLKLFGLLCSNSQTRMETEEEDIGLKNFATMFKAFAKLYLLQEQHWRAETLDELMLEGQQLLHNSIGHEVNEQSDPNILAYNANERNVKREFDMGDRIFHIELGPKFYPTDKMNQETKQRWSAFFNQPKRWRSTENQMPELQFDADPDLPFSMLHETLQHFFKKNKFGLLRFNQNRYFLIWKQFEVYFVLDFYGRSPITYHTECIGAVAAMFLVPTLSSFCVLISNMSVLGPSDSFCLREMLLIRVAGPNGEALETSYGWRSNQWLILASNYAVLKADLHLSMKPNANVRNRSALIAGIVAILASKIDHPALWTTRILNRILCYSVNFYRNSLSKILEKNHEIDLAKFPRTLIIGQFRACFDLKPMKYQGLYKCVPNLETSDFIAALKLAFERGDKHLLLQISNQVFAIWKKSNGFYYLFDPFRHKIHGLNSEPYTASLRMFCHVDKLIEVLTRMLWQFTRTSRVYIHVVEVKKIVSAVKKPTKKVKKGSEEEESDEFAHCKEMEAPQIEADVITLNEEIFFREDEIQCMDELGQWSEIEEEEEEIGESEYEEEMIPGEDAVEAEHRNVGDSDDDDDDNAPKDYPNQTNFTSEGIELPNEQTKKEGNSGGVQALGSSNKQGAGGKQNQQNQHGGRNKKGKQKRRKSKRNTESNDFHFEKKDGVSKEHQEPKEGMSEKINNNNNDHAGNKVPAEVKTKQIGMENNDKKTQNKKKENSKVNPVNTNDKTPNKVATNISAGRKMKIYNTDTQNATNNIVNNAEMTDEDYMRLANALPDSDNDLPASQGRPRTKPIKDKSKYTEQTYNLNDDKDFKKKNVVNRIDYSDYYDKDNKSNNNVKTNNNDGKNRDISENMQQSRGIKKNNTTMSNADGKAINNQSKTRDDNTKGEESKSILRSKTSDDKSETERELEFKKKLQKLEKLAQLKDEGGLAEKLRRRFAEQSRCLADECRLRGPTESAGLQEEESCKQSHDLVVVGTENGSVDCIHKLLRNGFRCVDRVYLITPWSNYVIFRSFSLEQKLYFLFEGCTCDINRFRYMDVKAGMEDLRCFCHLSEVCQHIANMRPLQPSITECF